ncbi:GNAT family N-acetyltransferase [Sporolactobacillus shoreicorticis]|uniref:GNAT family N-acetyltransferase n=1 Tax=Sporolactobacillus shoreicorticis TaxID=1923877 RepID=A0ABW5S9J6_9BACL|nr:GNAT family N-acetyltransferase [Sporolactobacillus shoreicorticis]MCO7125698.1 GNAT family N-acetyltransferase [Sporolactobacillus shoreicorticis]
MGIQIRKIGQKDRAEVKKLLAKYWNGTVMAIHGELIDMMTLPGLVAFVNDQITGMLTYRHDLKGIEIISLDSFVENQGIGSALVNEIIKLTEPGMSLRVTTTNDNTHALFFYQKKGFTLSALYLDAVSDARKLKPSIPVANKEGIPIEHEIELTYRR